LGLFEVGQHDLLEGDVVGLPARVELHPTIGSDQQVGMPRPAGRAQQPRDGGQLGVAAARADQQPVAGEQLVDIGR